MRQKNLKHKTTLYKNLSSRLQYCSVTGQAGKVDKGAGQEKANSGRTLRMDQEWKVRSKFYGRERTENVVRSDPHVWREDGGRSNRELYGALSCTSCFFLSSSTWLTLLWGAAGRGAWATYDTWLQSLPTQCDVKNTHKDKHKLTHTQRGLWYLRQGA